MINIDDVRGIISSVGGYDDAAIEKYLSVINSAVIGVERIVKDDSFCNDSRVVFLAGIRACRDISFVCESSTGVTSFKVGSISIKENSGSSNFDNLYKSALDDCKDLLKDTSDAFAFINV